MLRDRDDLAASTSHRKRAVNFRSLLCDQLFIVSLLLALQLVNQAGYVFMGVYRSEYFTWGPNERLFFVGAPIDTWPRWGYLIASRVISVLSNNALGGMIEAWITGELQNEARVYLPYSKWKCRVIVQLHAIYGSFNQILSLFLMLTQADIALVEIVCEAVVLQTITLGRWLRRKRYVAHESTLADLFIE